MFVKPANLGSSVGISKAKDRGQSARGDGSRGILRPQDHHRGGRAERARDRMRRARQRRAADVGARAKSSPRASSTTTKRSTSTRARRPSFRPTCRATVADEIRRLSVAAFQAIDCAGMARVDFLLSRDNGAIVLNEVNTIPGFTTISMYSKLWEASGVSLPCAHRSARRAGARTPRRKQQLRTSVS